MFSERTCFSTANSEAKPLLIFGRCTSLELLDTCFAQFAVLFGNLPDCEFVDAADELHQQPCFRVPCHVAVERPYSWIVCDESQSYPAKAFGRCDVSSNQAIQGVLVALESSLALWL